jgi:hypothetical protein
LFSFLLALLSEDSHTPVIVTVEKKRRKKQNVCTIYLYQMMEFGILDIVFHFCGQFPFSARNNGYSVPARIA